MACALPAAATLWWYCRALDRDGSGRVVFTLDDAAEAMDISKPTLYRWFAKCRAMGLLEKLNSDRAVHAVSYLSIVKAAVLAGVDSVGACGFIPMAQARSIKILATDMQLEANQQASIYAAAKAAQRGDTLTAIEETLVRPIFEAPAHSCLSWGGAKHMAGIKHVGQKTVFVSAGYLLSGASQSSAAETLQVSSATVSRRTSAQFRSKAPYGHDRGIELVEHRQIARQDLTMGKQALEQTLEQVALTQGIEAAEEHRRHFLCSGRVWRSECNLYWFRDLDLHPKRHWRGDLKQAKESGLWKRMAVGQGIFSRVPKT